MFLVWSPFKPVEATKSTEKQTKETEKKENPQVKTKYCVNGFLSFF